MSTAVAVHRPTTAPAPKVEWADEIRGATMLVKSGLCPTAIKTPEAALFVILAGRDLGLSPVASLRNITVIQGKIEVAADMQLALFHREGGKSRWLELTDKRAALELTAPWTSAPHTSEFTTDDAKRAGLQGDNWRKYPKAMLRSRAITQGLKDIGYDATAGVYAPGEIGGPEREIEPEATAEVVEVEAVPELTPEAALNFTMPVGNSKGKLLSQLTNQTLSKAQEYFKPRPEYAEALAAVELVMVMRNSGEALDRQTVKESGKKKKAEPERDASFDDLPAGLQDESADFLDRLDTEGVS